jgi:aryl-alcohol dehydrogenase-like predicted oxidoreductase
VGVLPLCRELDVSYIPYFPLASGLLTGKYRRGEPAPAGTRLAGRQIEDERFDRVEALTAFAEERGHTLQELALSALASTPGIGSLIAGATRPEQVRANAAAASWLLSSDELDALATI